MVPRKKGFALKAAFVVTGLAVAALTSARAAPPDSNDAALAFDQSRYTTIYVTIDGQTMPVRWYKEVCYVTRPVAMASTQTSMFGGTTTLSNPQCGYQSMNIFVPERAANDQKTAIYFAVNNGGWMSSYVKASVTDGASFTSSSSNVGAALKAGYVYIDVGTRGRGITAADGSYGGKAPNVIVDAKAAVRYLRLNDRVMPGSAERIVVNGTSGGGGLASILGASGNSPDYLPYLRAIGAAGVNGVGQSTLRDDVFAINAYCPITDLGNADFAYEWLYTALGTRATVGANPNPAWSAQIAAKFPAYERELRLRESDGRPLTTDNMLEVIKGEVKRSAETYLRASSSNSIPALGQSFTITSQGFGGGASTTVTYVNDWIDVDSATQTVRSIDMEKYLKFVATLTTLKGTPAFDATGIGSGAGESNLFGTASQAYSNFTEFSWNHNNIINDGIGYDDTGLTWDEFARTSTGQRVQAQVKLINPMHYLLETHATAAPYWYVRHGTRDRDTAFTVSINLSRALAATRGVKDVNYRLAWNQPHAGNYDVPEAMQWIADVLAKGASEGRRN